ncbi:MAG: hypothetical protein ACJ736_27410 [Streptomyces sp.]
MLVSAGIGCTPMTGILAHLAALRSPRPVMALHADRSPTDHALRTETRRLTGQLPDAWRSSAPICGCPARRLAGAARSDGVRGPCSPKWRPAGRSSPRSIQ